MSADLTVPLSQECADYATSLRSAVNVIRLEGRKAPPSFLRAADLFERSATELTSLQARLEAAERDTSRLLTLLRFAEVDINAQRPTGYFVAIKPRGHAPLWWYGRGPTLDAALNEIFDAPVTKRFLAVLDAATQEKPAAPSEGSQG